MNHQEFENTLTDIFQTAANMNLLPDTRSTTCSQFLMNPQQMVAKKKVTSSDVIDKRLQEQQLQELTSSKEFKALQERIKALKDMSGWLDYLDYTEIIFNKAGVKVEVNPSYLAQQVARADIRRHFVA